MLFPAIDDTIIAVSSGWQASPLGILRLSGPDAYRLVASAGLHPPTSVGAAVSRSIATRGLIQIAGTPPLPAIAYWFKGPRSYTGQDVVELHVPGCLPLLRELSTQLIEQGARRALPGEFTARAYLASKLSVPQIEDVLAALTVDRDSEQRQERRARRAKLEQRRAAVRERLGDLLALVEAGIDFAEEEDVHLPGAAELHGALSTVLEELGQCNSASSHPLRLVRPHAALVGLPNAGKSTLFNALLGYERAIVSPILGTTRDVLSAEVTIDSVQLVLQDCAGLGRAAGDLELAAHLAAERSVAQADLIIWVHASDTPWDGAAARVMADTPPERRLFVLSKCDLAPDCPAHPIAQSEFPRAVRVSAATGLGLEALRHEIAASVSNLPATPPAADSVNDAAALAAIRRAQSLCANPAGRDQPELLALEIRAAYDELTGSTPAEVVEDLLGRLFNEFCIGK